MKMSLSHVMLLFAALSFGCEVQMPTEADLNMSELEFEDQQRKRLAAHMDFDSLFPEEPARALAAAAGKGDLALIDRLVRSGVSVDSRGEVGATPLFWALRRANIEGFRELLAYGADPNIVFEDGGSVMHWAVRLEDTRYLQLALTHGGDPNRRSEKLRRTPFVTAAQSVTRGDFSALTLLLDYGADINVRSDRGNTPVMIAAVNGRFDLVLFLLENGANYLVRNEAGYTFVDMVRAKQGAFIPGSVGKRDLDRVTQWLAARGIDI